MTKLLKLFLPFVTMLVYALSASIIYQNVDKDVLIIGDCVKIVIGNILLIIIAILYNKLLGHNFKCLFANSNLSGKKCVLILLMIPGIYFLFSRIYIYIAHRIDEQFEMGTTSIGNLGLFVFNMLFALTLAPVLEELLFRMSVVHSYHSFLGKIYGVIAGAVIFGFCHSNAISRISATIVGIVLGSLFLLTKDILVCILVHSYINLLLTICGLLCYKMQDTEILGIRTSIIYVNNYILFISLVVSLVSMFLFQQIKLKG